ncbi:chalcone isomerase family protein [Shewanella sp.]|nr:chalcone isomerase family protein [Shewanella sp.]
MGFLGRYGIAVLMVSVISGHTMAQNIETSSPLLSVKGQDSAAGEHVIDNASLKEVGRGEMDWWWLTLYRARLLTLNGTYQQAQTPVTLEIEYYQDIPSERLLEATMDQWQHLKLNKQRQQRWQALLSQLWPDVTEGDTLSLHVLTPRSSQFYFNGKPLPLLMPEGFSDDFLAIWLSAQTSQPELRQQLLGELPCDC